MSKMTQTDKEWVTEITDLKVFEVMPGYVYEKKALQEAILNRLREGRIAENQMGLNWQLAVKNGLEQQSENASLTSTWKANELIISQFRYRLAELKGAKDE